MGQVYVGHDTLLDRPVAIKFIAKVDPDVVARERFLIETRAIARLQHPKVGAIYRVGEIGALPYLGNPYRGLLPFETEHRTLFFGREPDVRTMRTPATVT